MTFEHLLPSVHEIALLPASERITRLRNDYWVGYGYAEQALEKLEDLFNRPKRVRMQNMLIVGPTNNGKTMIVEKFRRQHLSYASADGSHEIIPVVFVQMPSDPTIQRFYAAIMEATGAPVITYGSIVQYETVAMRILKIIQTKILIIDELHNILAGNSSKQREFLNVLRFIGNQLQISLIGVGTKEAYYAIRSDPQLENRFEPLVLPLWKNDPEFMRLLGSFQKVLPLQLPSDLLLDADIRIEILARSEGTIGEISSLLTQAACEAISSGKERIDREIIEQTKYRSPTERRRRYDSDVE